MLLQIRWQMEQARGHGFSRSYMMGIADASGAGILNK